MKFDWFIKLLINLIPCKKYRKKLRESYLNREFNKKKSIKSQHYGKIYIPYYPDVEFTQEPLEIYNKEGNPMDVYFLRDQAGSHCPYRDASKYFLWDRFNIGLKTHFYTHSAMLETMGNPDKRYGLFVESKSIIPDEYEIFKKHKGLEKDFDKIFTYDEELLNTVDNTVLFPACASVWYSKEVYNGESDSVKLSDSACEKKDKLVSMCCSEKVGTPMPRIRHKFAYDALKTGNVDIYGKFNGGEFLKFKSESLEKYMFQIVVENDYTPYYFTEKIMDCLVSMTIPIYMGATKIDEFFNPDGIITINKDSDIEKVLKQCTKEEYENRKKAVIDNYYRSLRYYNLNDLLYETHLKVKNN